MSTFSKKFWDLKIIKRRRNQNILIREIFRLMLPIKDKTIYTFLIVYLGNCELIINLKKTYYNMGGI